MSHSLGIEQDISAGRGELRKAARLLAALASFALFMLDDAPDGVTVAPKSEPVCDEAPKEKPESPTAARYRASRDAVKAAILSHGCTFGDFCSRACGFNGWHETPKKEFAALNHEIISTLVAASAGMTNTEWSARRGYLFRAVIEAFPTAAASLHVVKPAADKVSWFDAEPWDEGTIEEFRALAEFSHPGLKYHAGV